MVRILDRDARPPHGRRVLLDRSLDRARIRKLLRDADAALQCLDGAPAGADVVALVAWERPVGAADLARLPGLELVLTPSVGFDHIDLDAARRHGGLYVCHVPDYCVDEMADSALAHVLALMRGIVALDRSVRASRWDAGAAGPLRRIRGTRLGIVGFGRIGAALARRARALGFEVWATDPAVPAEAMAAAGVRPCALAELLAACPVVSLHAPLTAETEGVIGAAELARMPRGGLLVNVSRGGLVDTEAVLAALESGRLAGAALDVLPVEPPTPESPAPRAEALTVTPHAAYCSPEAEAELHRRVAAAIRAVLEGRRPDGALVTPRGRA
jgi:D-3-phosphoglycerate dehydrogenase / 2-oxoglutarate reductase